MSIKRTIIRLYDNEENFLQHLRKGARKYNKAFGDSVVLDETAAKAAVIYWRAILGSRFEFVDGDFAVLVEEIFGELLFTIHRHQPKLFAGGVKPYSNIMCCAYITAQLACRFANVPFLVSKPDLNAFALTLRSQPYQSQRYAHHLHLPPF